jgi:hypothetical protein
LSRPVDDCEVPDIDKKPFGDEVGNRYFVSF